MIIEEALEYLLDYIPTLTIPQSFMNLFSAFLDFLGNLNFILPVSTLIECILFTMSFALACGLVRTIIVRK